LRESLEAIVLQADGLNRPKKMVKFPTALKLYHADFREKFADALKEFTFGMLIESERSMYEIDIKIEGILQAMKDLQITTRTFDNMPDTESIIKIPQRKRVRISEECRELKTAVKLTMTSSKLRGLSRRKSNVS
jgi:hypothetical protein